MIDDLVALEHADALRENTKAQKALLDATIIAKGDQGPQGIKGDTGDKGDQGIQGLKGNTGLKGEKGDRGFIGPSGVKGDQGDKGSTGIKGVDGAGPDERVRVSATDPVAGFLADKLTAGNGVKIRKASSKKGDRLVIDVTEQGGLGGGSAGIVVFDDGAGGIAGNKLSFDGGDPITSSGGIIHVPVGGAGTGGTADTPGWQPAHYVGSWAIGTTYDLGDAVRADDSGTWKLYISLVAANLANDPVGDAVNWLDTVANGRPVVVEGAAHPAAEELVASFGTRYYTIDADAGFSPLSAYSYSLLGWQAFNFLRDTSADARDLLEQVHVVRDGAGDGTAVIQHEVIREGSGTGGAIIAQYASVGGTAIGVAQSNLEAFVRDDAVGNANAALESAIQDAAVGEAEAHLLALHYTTGEYRVAAVANATEGYLSIRAIITGLDTFETRWLAGTADPSAGAGIAAPVLSIYTRNNAGTGELWFKEGSGDTDWAQLGTGGGTPAVDPGAPPAAIADPTLATAEDVALAYNDLQAWAADLRNAMLTAGSLA